MKQNIILTILIICFLAIALFSGWQLWGIYAEYKAGTDVYDDLEQYVTTQTPNPEEPETDVDPADIANIVWPEVDFDALKKINEDIVGWIYLEGTKINYPIVRGDDNDYYLNRLYDGTGNGSGSIFMDYRVSGDFTAYNSPIYGHRMNNGSMFAAVGKYSNQEFFYGHPRFLILTPDKNYRMEVFSAYVAKDTDRSWEYEFPDEATYEDWLKVVKDKSYFPSEVTPKKTEKTVTLSTCTYEFENARFIVHGVLREAAPAE